MTEENKNNFDVLVIGGGPAGITAAIRAGQMGASVAILEKNETLGNKLLLTGGRRCNITNTSFDTKELAKQYGKEGDFLLHALSVFGVKETIAFFNKNVSKPKWKKTAGFFLKATRQTTF
jgi:predicted flavoprotein YhiN